jgi:hypothetical protein
LGKDFFLMKRWAIVIAVVAAALVVTMADYRLASLPPRMLMFRWYPMDTTDKDPNVYIMVRNCARYAHSSGMWWWKRTQVDYVPCSADPATETELKVIGQIKQEGSAPPVRIHLFYACVTCQAGRLLSAVTIPLPPTAEDAAPVLTIPLQLRLNPEDELQLLFTPKTAPGAPQSTGMPDVE